MTIKQWVKAISIMAILFCLSPHSFILGQESIFRPDFLYPSMRLGSSDIELVKGDVRMNLTRTEWHEVFPAWSPDGRKIAFNAFPDRKNRIYVMNADGFDRVALTDGPHDRAPTWSPDGKQIAFCRALEVNNTFNYEVFVMDADGSNQRNLTNDPAFDGDPAWSPDGSTIAFASNRGDKAGFKLCLVDAARGGSLRVLSHSVQYGFVYPAWSPDGTQLAFTNIDAKGDFTIHVINRDGTSRRQLTAGGFDTYAAWSPDGQTITFSRYPDFARKDEGTLMIVPTSGGAAVEVSGFQKQLRGQGGRISWRPVR